VLARQQPVTIGTPNESGLQSSSLAVRCYQGAAMASLVEEHPIVVAFGYLLRHYPVIRQKAAYLVMDLYDPFLLENLLMHDDLPMPRREAVHESDLGVVMDQLRQADFFVCASERQRDYWLGALSMLNRVNPRSYTEDPTLRRLIDVVPFGVPAAPPHATAPAIRKEVPGIGADDIVVLWGGGIWNWFDPLTAIRAVNAVKDDVSQLRLYFMGLRHPNPELPQMEMARRAVGLSRELGLLDRFVFFRDGWVPYDQRVNYLLAADLGISLHLQHIETRFSFRTRLLDYLWAGLPTIATEGDVLSEEMAARGAGLTLAEGDVAAAAAAFSALAKDPERRRSMRTRALELAAEHTWQAAAEPLLAYCRAPRKSQPGRSTVPGGAQLPDRLRAAWQRSWMRRTASRIRRRARGRRRSS
jgi:glycosyltransferase involved in cell wall biosynthesis